MTGRERVRAAMHYKPVDKVPLQYYYTPVGIYEHGEKINDLYATAPGDFEPFRRLDPVGPAPEDHDAEGRYFAQKTDEWGTVWDYRIFGITGMPSYYPLKDLENLKTYKFPPLPPMSGPEFEADKRRMQEHQKQYYGSAGAGSLFERMIALRSDEEVLMDMVLGTPEQEELADRIAEYDRALAERAVALGADGVGFGDDYGTERALLMSPKLWRSYIKPRLKYIFEPAVKAGLDIPFHSCGMIKDILEDLREIGVTSIWPQLPAYNMEELAHICRDLGLAVAIHTDRANAMTHGTPQQVRDLVKREFDTFRMMEGGSWFYVEADNGFPFANIEALVETIREWR